MEHRLDNLHICERCNRSFKCLDKHLETQKQCLSYYSNKLGFNYDNLTKTNKKKILDSVCNHEYRLSVSKKSLNQWNDPEKRKFLIEKQKEANSYPEVREANRQRSLQLWKNPKYKQKNIDSHLGQYVSEETKEKHRKDSKRNSELYRNLLKKRWIEKEYLFKRYLNSKKHKEFSVKNLTNLWLNIQFRKNNIHRMKTGGAVHAMSFNKSPSKPQVALFNLVKELYSSAIINHPLKEINRCLDIAIPELKLDIEFDGSYWHQNKEADIIREEQIRNLGWNIIRFVDHIPTKEVLVERIKQHYA